MVSLEHLSSQELLLHRVCCHVVLKPSLREIVLLSTSEVTIRASLRFWVLFLLTTVESLGTELGAILPLFIL